jgi:ribosomal protein L37AE/L43A
VNFDGNRSAWLALAVRERTQHAGNDGYGDEIASSYRWDSTVPHAQDVAPGDIIAVWDKHSLLGVSIIEGISETIGRSKSVYRCPDCTRSTIKRRVNLRPTFKCHSCDSTFDTPLTKTLHVDLFESVHASSWVDLQGTLDATELRSLCLRPKSQQSFRLLDESRFWEALRRALVANGSDASVLNRFTPTIGS